MEHLYSVGGLKSSKFSKIMEESTMPLLNIPVDIITNILSRLPLETLIRCRSVCKLWLNIINHPNFTYPTGDFLYLASFKDEIEEDKGTNPRKRRNQSFSLHLLTFDKSVVGLEKVWKKSENPTTSNIKCKGHNFKCIVGSSKGLVCFIREKEMHIVNPLFSNDILSVPLPYPGALSQGHDDTSYLSYSFGFDESSKSFKVICILQCAAGHCRRPSSSAPLILDLGMGMGMGLSSSSSSEFRWRALSSPSIRYPCIHSKGCQSLFVDGAFLLLGKRTSPGCGEIEILSINLEKEVFKVITLPVLAPRIWKRLSLFDFNGSIGLMGLLGDGGDKIMRIWAFNNDDESSDMNMWVEEFQFQVATNWYESLHAAGFDKTKCDILFRMNFGGYHAYNTQTGITCDPPNDPPGLNPRNLLLLRQASLLRASNLTPLDSSSKNYDVLFIQH